MLKRIAVAASAIAVVGLLGTGAAAQAQTAGPSSAARTAPHATVVHLRQAYQRALGHVRKGKISGIVYPLGRQPRPAARLANCTEPNCPLTYAGGPVQHSPHVYLLLWGPNWSADPNQAASAAYLENFYAGLGVQPQDGWSTITTQYGDSTGFPAFTGSVYEGAFHDTTTPPAGVTQAQLAAEADAFASTDGITDLNDAQIVVATQSGTCPQGFYSPGTCGTTSGYCAWHSSSNEPYTNLPYILDAGKGCGKDFVNPSGTDDGLSIVAGHEYAESITDPIPPTGWVDPNDTVSGGEIADKCAWGGKLWNGHDPAGNVTLSTGTFAMQSLWSNNASGCVMSTVKPPAGHPIKGLHGVCLDDSGGRTSNGNKIDIWKCNGTGAQKWTLGSNGTLSVLGGCLADKRYTGAGTKLVLWACIGHRNEQWKHRSNGEFVLAAKGLCLTDPSGSAKNGTQVEIRACHDFKDQRWSGP
jgi:serine protease